MAIRIDESRHFFSDTHLHDFFVSSKFLGFEQRMCRVECRTPYEETTVFSHCCGVSPSIDVLHNNIFKSMNFERYI
jgi:hypothetical protein